MKPDHDNTVEISARVLLVQEPGKNLLVMAGPIICRRHLRAPAVASPRMPGLLESLAQRGLNESDIDSVVLTHVHAHLSDDMSERVREGDMPRLLFPRARYLCGERH